MVGLVIFGIIVVVIIVAYIFLTADDCGPNGCIHNEIDPY